MKELISNNTTKFMDWVEHRFPIQAIIRASASEYYAPKNFNFWYFFGSLALLVLVIQIVSGIFLTMSYKPSAEEAFASVEYIMRDVRFGWLIRYIHSTGATAFFIVVYLHMFRGLLYGSYRAPRELLWIVGMLIYIVLMAEGFMGYLLPWGQMSYWAAQVIVNLVGVIPFIGDMLALVVRGDFVISDITLNRFFALHVIALPLALVALVVVHLIALHEVGSNNPDGIEINDNLDADGKPVDGVPFHPYYTVKDIVGVAVFLIFFAIVIFYLPEMGGYFLEANNFIPADPLKTPEHIAPVWYFAPFYAILRAIPNPLLGFIAMGASIMMFFFLPWLDRSPVRSIRYKGPLTKMALTAFALAFLVLGYLGLMPPTELYTQLARFFSLVYFGFFLLMPIYTSIDSTKPLPDRLT